MKYKTLCNWNDMNQYEIIEVTINDMIWHENDMEWYDTICKVYEIVWFYIMWYEVKQDYMKWFEITRSDINRHEVIWCNEKWHENFLFILVSVGSMSLSLSLSICLYVCHMLFCLSVIC